MILVEDEKLAAVGVGTAVGHGDDAAFVTGAALVELAVACDLVAEGAAPGALAAGAVALRIAALDHEALHDAVERQAVVETALGEQAEILGGLGGVGGQQLKLDHAFVGLDHGEEWAGRRAGGGGRLVVGAAATREGEQREQKK